MLKIPRVFHRIWLGERPLPDEFADYGRTWQLHHPHWEMRLWSEPELAALELINRGILHLARNHAQRSDVYRYELLWLFGGVYLDTDFECLKPIEPLLDDAEFVGAGELPDMVSAGFIAAVPRHPLVFDAIQSLPARIASDLHQAKSTGPGMLTEAWQRHRHLPAVKTYGPELFYPYGWRESHRRCEPFPNAYAVHHWAGSWVHGR